MYMTDLIPYSKRQPINLGVTNLEDEVTTLGKGVMFCHNDNGDSFGNLQLSLNT